MTYVNQQFSTDTIANSNVHGHLESDFNMDIRDLARVVGKENRILKEINKCFSDNSAQPSALPPWRIGNPFSTPSMQNVYNVISNSIAKECFISQNNMSHDNIVHMEVAMEEISYVPLEEYMVQQSSEANGSMSKPPLLAIRDHGNDEQISDTNYVDNFSSQVHKMTNNVRFSLHNRNNEKENNIFP